MKLDTIGKRAAWALDERCVQTRVRKKVEYEKLCLDYSLVSNWRQGACNPDAFALQQMALNGYDVFWILTGRKSDEI